MSEERLKSRHNFPFVLTTCIAFLFKARHLKAMETKQLSAALSYAY